MECGREDPRSVRTPRKQRRQRTGFRRRKQQRFKKKNTRIKPISQAQDELKLVRESEDQLEERQGKAVLLSEKPAVIQTIVERHDERKGRENVFRYSVPEKQLPVEPVDEDVNIVLEKPIRKYSENEGCWSASLVSGFSPAISDTCTCVQYSM